MPGMANPKPGPETPVLSIRDLVSYRLSRAASLMSRGAALRYRREFNVSLGEWRALALLAVGSDQTLMALSRAAGLDKAQMSRVVTSLVERSLVLREPVAGDGRTARLSLTEAGRVLYGRLIAAAGERDQAFRAALSDDEFATLEAALHKLVAQARSFIRMEAEAAGEEVSEP